MLFRSKTGQRQHNTALLNLIIVRLIELAEEFVSLCVGSIGRASCRGRVEVSVVAVTLRKEKLRQGKYAERVI